MRVLLLFRGAPGCGKSTFIEQHGLKPFALSADEIRCMYASPALLANGKTGISGNNEKVVWDNLFRILEHRMTNGDFCVIDATNTKTAEINRYKELAQNYRYRIYIVDMTDLPIEECKRRNAQRPEMKRVPEEVIDKAYSRFQTQQIPAGVKTIKPEEIDSIWYRPTDLSQYKKIHVIGDIHGCYTALMDYIDLHCGGVKPDEAFIFLGDYIDRGVENVDVVNWVCKQSKYPNMIFLEGNHERWLWCWANDVPSKSKEFENVTRVQLDYANVSKKAVREFYRRLGQCVYFTYHDKTFLVTHGGLSCLPDNLTKVQTYQMVRGVGNYSDAQVVDDAFVENTPDNVFQIHGHRNITKSPVQVNDRCFNLEGDVEFGGCLRAVQITPDDIQTFEVQNNVIKEVDIHEQNTVPVDSSVERVVQEMRSNRMVQEKRFGNISSFNFTRQAFQKDQWDNMTVAARGLYIDTNRYEVVARAYDKFFNINERPETKLANLKLKLKFPVHAYVKYNGFLGLVGWNYDTDDLFITTKSSPEGEFAKWFKEDLYKCYGEETMNKIRDFVKENHATLVFECCDIERDPHIIEYPSTQVVLLEVVKNDLKYRHLTYDNLVNVAIKLGVKVKYLAYTLDTWEDFFAWYNEVTSEGYLYNGENIEGFVIEDADCYMVKIKLYYYKLWKRLRGVAATTIRSGNYRYTGSLLTPVENAFFGYCKMLFKEHTEDRRELSDKCRSNIIELRKQFYEWLGSRGESID